MVTKLEEREVSLTKIQALELFGFQAGEDGFVRYGLGSGEAIDYLFLRVCGGRRGGKTFTAALRSLLYMKEWPGSQGMIVALINDNLNITIMPTLRGVMGRFGLKEGEDWEYNMQRRELALWNGSVAYLRTAEFPERLPGPDLAWFWLDEWRIMSERVFTVLVPSLTQEGYPHQAWLTSTPGGRRHWSRKVFFPKKYAKDFDVPVYDRPAGEYRTYHTTTFDNPHTSKEAKQVMLATYGGERTALARQELFGEEILLEGLKFPTWDAKYHMKPREEWLGKPYHILAGVDFGYETPSAILVEAVDRTGKKRYLMDEFYKTHCKQEELIAIAKSFMKKYDIELFICDPEDARWRAAIRSASLPVRKAKKDRSFGFSCCAAALSADSDDKQTFFVDPKLVHFRREIEGYQNEELKDNENASEKPRACADHLMSAWRYLETFIARTYARGERNIKGLDFSVGQR